jgi:hypothetical protein
MASRLNLATILLLDNHTTWQECFLAQTKIVLDHMRAIVDRGNYGPLLRFYSRHASNLADELAQMDFSLLMAVINRPDALFTASSIAAEYLAADLGKGAIPNSVEQRLERTIDQYELLRLDPIEVGLVVPSKRFSSKLVPMHLFAQRHGSQTASLSMEHYIAQCAVPHVLAERDDTMRHLSSILGMIVRESMTPKAKDVFEWKRQADKVVSIGTMLLKPVDNVLIRRVKSGHEDPSASEHILLLPSFKQMLTSWIDSGANGLVWASRLEWDASLSRMAYLVYAADLVRTDASMIEPLKETPWHDRWSFFTEHPWTRDCIQWISPAGPPDQGTEFVAPVSLGAASPLTRLLWWVERQLRTMLGVKTTDVRVDYDPHLACACASFYLPKSAKVPAEWTVDWKQLANEV